MCMCLSSTRVLTSWTHPCFWQMAPTVLGSEYQVEQDRRLLSEQRPLVSRKQGRTKKAELGAKG